MLADTAIVGKNCFFHYCHYVKGLMALRIHRSNCPFCMQKNPDYIPNHLIHVVSNLETGQVVMTFSDWEKAIRYMQSHHRENLSLSDSGYVE